MTMTTQDTEGHIPSDESSAPQSSRRERWWATLGFSNVSALYLLAVVIVVFAFWAPDTFLTKDTLLQILNQNAVSAIVALALVVPLSAHTFDLSVGASVGLTTAIDVST
jgi:ribose transport system permease protein